MAFRLRNSLKTFLAQVNAAAPGRSKASDGGEPSAAHLAASPNSDHNTGHAFDITNDPAHGVVSRTIGNQIIASRDRRIKYVIRDGEIASSEAYENAKPAGSSRNTPWIWRPYTGTNAHRQHVHLSVMPDPLADDPAPWAITLGAAQLARPGLFTGITATVFGGPSDAMSGTETAYGNLIAPGWWDRPGVSLPARLTARPLPRVRVTHNGRSVVCAVIDVGPWNIRDPYWETGTRPRAESGEIDDYGRTPKNKAGIDLTPAAASAIGLPGLGLVDWEFVGIDGEVLPPLKENDMETDKIVAAVIAALQAQGVIKPPPPPVVGFDINQFMPLLQSPVVQKLIGGKGVTILELLPLIPAVMALLQGRAVPALPPPDPVAAPMVTPGPATADPTVKPAVSLSGAALALGAILQNYGVIGTPLGVGENPTPTGTLTTILPIISMAVGVLGGFGPAVNMVAKLFGYRKTT